MLLQQISHTHEEGVGGGQVLSCQWVSSQIVKLFALMKIAEIGDVLPAVPDYRLDFTVIIIQRGQHARIGILQRTLLLPDTRERLSDERGICQSQHVGNRRGDCAGTHETRDFPPSGKLTREDHEQRYLDLLGVEASTMAERVVVVTFCCAK